MKYEIFTTLALMLVGIPQILAVCSPNTACDKERDTIIQLNSEILPSERVRKHARTWYIKPSDAPFNAILAFKNFSSILASMMVITYKGQEKSIEYYYGKLTDFELVRSNVGGIIIYVPVTAESSVDFMLKYYTGCEMRISANDQIVSAPLLSTREKQAKCWFIQPSDNDDRKRIYFSLKGISLTDGHQLTVWDLHTMAVIARAENGKTHELVAAETQEHQTIVVDLICTRDDCNNQLNSFVVSYYGMTEEDITCIGIQRLCDDRKNAQFLQCDVACPAFNNMMMEEFGYEASGTFLRSGGLANDDANAESMDSETQETKKTRGEKTQRKRKRRCPLPKPLCNCRRAVNKHAFCNPSVDCFGLGQCTFACIFHKLTTCIRIQILNSLKLL